MNTDRYDAHTVEQKWQAVWDEAEAARVEDPDPDADRSQKSYVVEMWPYPSGSLHMGNVLVYTIGDVLSRFRRRKGLHVLHPIGFDSFGLPAENAALREGGHPREVIERNIRNITTSMRRMGWAFDWTRMISAHEPTYYVWDQWLFLKLLEAGLAYRKGAPVKWCPVDQVVLANEQVRRTAITAAGVIAKNLEQWFFKTTATPTTAGRPATSTGGTGSRRAAKSDQPSEGTEVLFRIEESEDARCYDPPTRSSGRRSSCWRRSIRSSSNGERSPHGASCAVREGRGKRGESAPPPRQTGVFWLSSRQAGERRDPVWVADYV